MLPMLICCGTSPLAQAGVVQEIKEGCSASAGMSAVCITLSPIYTTITAITVPYEMTVGEESKIVYQAQPDAALFVASEGKTKGVYLERAFDLLRKHSVYREVDDITLAQAILAYAENAN